MRERRSTDKEADEATKKVRIAVAITHSMQITFWEIIKIALTNWFSDSFGCHYHSDDEVGSKRAAVLVVAVVLHLLYVLFYPHRYCRVDSKGHSTLPAKERSRHAAMQTNKDMRYSVLLVIDALLSYHTIPIITIVEFLLFFCSSQWPACSLLFC